jgi:hypothetical protein
VPVGISLGGAAVGTMQMDAGVAGMLRASGMAGAQQVAAQQQLAALQAQRAAEAAAAAPTVATLRGWRAGRRLGAACPKPLPAARGLPAPLGH